MIEITSDLDRDEIFAKIQDKLYKYFPTELYRRVERELFTISEFRAILVEFAITYSNTAVQDETFSFYESIEFGSNKQYSEVQLQFLDDYLNIRVWNYGLNKSNNALLDFKVRYQDSVETLYSIFEVVQRLFQIRALIA